jgi:acetylglutamate kinase
MTEISPLDQARILSEALPHMQQYDEETIVIKYGGHAMGDEETAKNFARDIVLLEQTAINPVVVHGGGPQIGQMLERLKIKSSFIDGLRVTDKETVEIVEMVLAGSINKEIVGLINAAGGTAIGLSGKDGGLIRAKKLTRTKRDPDSNIEQVLDLGFVGEPTQVNAGVLELLTRSDIIPVVAPTGLGDAGETYNINADTSAGAVAAALKASRLLMLTDISGVMDKDKKIMPEISVDQARAMIADGTIYGGMIPKIETCLDAVEQGVEAAVILDGRKAHAILVELFISSGAGTLIRKK